MNPDQPEPPVDPPSEPADTPVDHAEVIRALLRDIERHASRLDTKPKMRTMFGCGIAALEEMLEVME